MKTKKWSVLMMVILLGSMAGAQSLESLSLNLEKIQASKTGQGDSKKTLDLLQEARRQSAKLKNLQNIDLALVETQMKTGVGGAGVYLIVNGQFIDSQAVETDPDLLNKKGGEVKVVLKNTERRVDDALLSVIGSSVIKSVVISFGSVEDIEVLGSYANADADAVGGGRERVQEQSVAVRPPADIVLPNGGQTSTDQQAQTQPQPQVAPPAQEPGPVFGGATKAKTKEQKPTVVIVKPTRKEKKPAPQVVVDPWAQEEDPVVTWVVQNCVRGICVGDVVANSFGIQGQVVRAYPPQGLLEVRYPFGSKPSLRKPGQVRLKKKGPRPS